MLVMFILLVLATASTTMTLAKSNVFKPWREFISLRSTFFGELVNCTYCTSHYVGFMFGLCFRKVEVLNDLPGLVAWFVLSMSLVSLSSIFQYVIYWSHAAMKRSENADGESETES